MYSFKTVIENYRLRFDCYILFNILYGMKNKPLGKLGLQIVCNFSIFLDTINPLIFIGYSSIYSSTLTLFFSLFCSQHNLMLLGLQWTSSLYSQPMQCRECCWLRFLQHWWKFDYFICMFYQCVGTLLTVSRVISTAGLGLLAAACYRDRWGQWLDRPSIHHTVYILREEQDNTYRRQQQERHARSIGDL